MEGVEGVEGVKGVWWGYAKEEADFLKV
jgi:hypothetical protein